MFDFFKKKPKEPVALCFATDMHCHIVPGVDDGSPDVGVSADLIEAMQRWGIKRILASPHVTQNTFENDHSTIDPAMEALRTELKARGNGIEVLNHAEYRIDELLMQRLESGDIMTLPNGFILIENSFMQEPWNLETLIFDLQVKACSPFWRTREVFVLLQSQGQAQGAAQDRTHVPDKSSQPRRRLRQGRAQGGRVSYKRGTCRLYRHRPAP